MKTTTNYNLNKPEITDYYNVDDFNDNMDTIDKQLKNNSNDVSNAQKTADNHISNKDNPHSVTASQVGLGNVPNVSTNNQTPTYTEATELTALSNGEKLFVAFGKIAKAISSLISHLANKSNPHGVTKTQLGIGNVENKSSETIRSEITSSNVTSALGYTPLNAALKGANSGVAELDASGKVPTSQLPSYVDDVLEYSSKSAFPSTGESGKIYIATDTNLQYRWSGSAYAEISPSLALGETSSTAYRGDRGAAAYAHISNTSNPHGVTKAQVGLGNVPNVATNDQTPTYSDTTTLATLASGEKLSVAFPKIKLAITNLISHLSNKSNPHGVTASQVGLGNCDNTSDADKPISTATQAELDSKAPTSHASTGTTYGIGNASNYGHVKLTDSYTTPAPAAQGMGASSYAVYQAYTKLNNAKANMYSGTIPAFSSGTSGYLTIENVTSGIFTVFSGSAKGVYVVHPSGGVSNVYTSGQIPSASYDASTRKLAFSNGYGAFYLVGAYL